MNITGTSASDFTTLDTSLDTLNREVLLVWEVDVQGGAIPDAALGSGVTLLTGMSLEIHDSVQTESGALNLSSTDYIAGKQVKYFAFGGTNGGGITVQEENNPDSRDMGSRDEIPLAIITDSTITLRSGFSCNLSLGTTDVYQAHFRIIAQRAKADADTYAALVTGLM